MKVFYAVAEHLENRSKRVSAYVVADDADEAVHLLRHDEAFEDYALPPVELSEYGDGREAIRRILGPGALPEKGVFASGVREPAGG